MGKNYRHPADPELMHRASDGDDAACRELVDRHAPHLCRLAFHLVGKAIDAEDVLQETFSGAFRQLRKFEQRSTVKTWLSQTLVRQAAKCRRSRRKHNMVSLNGLSETAEGLLVGKAATTAQTESDTRMDVMAMLETPQREKYEELLKQRAGWNRRHGRPVMAAPGPGPKAPPHSGE